MIQYIKDKNINNITELSIILHKGCNLGCSYCTQERYSDSNDEKMTLETFKKFYQDFGFKNLNKVINLELFGGEPLLNFETIKEIFDYLYNDLSEEQRKLIYVKINTNGILINEEVIEYFKFIGKEFNLRFIISYDGLWQDQRSNPEQNKLIVDNIHKVLDNCLSKATKLSYSVYLHPEKILKNHLWFMQNFLISENQIQYYLIREPWLWNDELFGKYKKGFTEYFKYYLVKEKQYGLIPGYIQNKIQEINNPKNGCNMGYSRFTLMPDYNKTETLSNCGLDNEFNYDPRVNYEEIEDNCKDCEIKDHCNKLCPKKINYKNSRDLNYLCEIKKFEYNLFLKNKQDVIK